MSADGSSSLPSPLPAAQVKQQPLQQQTSIERRSSRSIKRKKFDDELVESSILIPKGRGKNVTVPNTVASTSSLSNLSISLANSPAAQSTSKLNSPAGVDSSNLQPKPTTISTPLSAPATVVSNLVETQPSTPAPAPPKPAPVEHTPSQPKKPKPIATTTRRRRYRNAHNNAVKDLGRWKPQDDLALVVAVQQLNDLDAVHRSVKFSCKFTLKEIENRWFGLLYDPTLAKIGVAAMRQLHPDVVSQIHINAPYNEDEEKLLKAISSNSHPNSETFVELLQSHIDVFLPYRTAKNLHSHWLRLKHFHLLNDQTVEQFNKLDEVPSFSDAEEQIENELQGMLNSNVPSTPVSSSFKQEDIINQELALNNRKTKREIRQLENEIPKWQMLVDSLTGVAPSDFDNETYAVLRGRRVRYLMRSKEITLGRCTNDSTVDVNLSLEGPSSKISRKQALIYLNSNGDFIITNTGKHAFVVDSKPILGNLSSCKLNNNSIVEIAGLRFVFLINQDLISNKIRVESLLMSH